jgi:hypothetical protein
MERPGRIVLVVRQNQPQIFGPNINRQFVIDLWKDDNPGERRVAPCVDVIRRNANHPMLAGFAS